MNLELLAAFFGALFPDPGGYVDLRALPGADQAFVHPTELAGIERFCSRHREHNCYFGVARRGTPNGGDLGNCDLVNAVWIDIDFKQTPEDQARHGLVAFPLAPSIVVTSGGGLHVYWLFREPLALASKAARLKDVLRRLAHALGGDLASAEPARILRIPGTTNYKYEPPRPVELELLEVERRYNPIDFEELLPVEPSPVDAPRMPFTMPELIPDGQRNATLYRLARSLRTKGLSPDGILAALRAENLARCRPPLPDPEIVQLATESVHQADRADFKAPSPGAPGRPALQVLSWEEMTTGPLRPITYHWPGWVGLATVAVLAGAGDSLKSWLCLYLACMTAAGRPVFAEPGTEEPPITAGPVLYLTGENAIDEEKRRCQLLKAGLELPAELPITFVAADGLVLGDEEDYRAVLDLIRQRQPVALFVDSAIALSGIIRENDNAEVRAFMKRRILPFARQHGITVYLIQHSPKPPLQPGMKLTDEHVARGAGDWRNAADVVLYLRRDPSLGELAVVLRHAKNRVGPRHRPVWFQLEDVEPDRAARLTYGGVYSDEAQGIAAGVRKAVAAAVSSLKASPTGVYLRALGEEVKASSGVTTATYRRALEILRGKKPWPFGPHRGKRHAVLTEDRHGKQVFVVFDVAQWPEDEDWDDT